MTPDELVEFEALLVAKRDELSAGKHYDREASKPVQLDQQSVGRLSRMDAMQVQAMAKDTERRRQIQLQRIEAALGRIRTGDYGLCARCEEDIATARLRIDPAAPLCIDCASESQG